MASKRSFKAQQQQKNSSRAQTPSTINDNFFFTHFILPLFTRIDPPLLPFRRPNLDLSLHPTSPHRYRCRSRHSSPFFLPSTLAIRFCSFCSYSSVRTLFFLIFSDNLTSGPHELSFLVQQTQKHGKLAYFFFQGRDVLCTLCTLCTGARQRIFYYSTLSITLSAFFLSHSLLLLVCISILPLRNCSIQQEQDPSLRVNTRPGWRNCTPPGHKHIFSFLTFPRLISPSVNNAFNNNYAI